jgi:Carboxypeptidase regulatory-like domain/Putative zinc-finger
MQNLPKIVRQRMKVEVSSANVLSDRLKANHPDANVLTAFAERALPQLERDAVLEHLARCDDCRDTVMFALPEPELTQTAILPSPKGWFAWPALRWGFITAGVAAIAALGVVQYQRRAQSAEFVARQSTANTRFADKPASQPAATAEPAARAASSLREQPSRRQSDSNESKMLANAAPSARFNTSSPALSSGANAFHGSVRTAPAAVPQPGSDMASNLKLDTPRVLESNASSPQVDTEITDGAVSTDEDASGSRGALSKAKPPVEASPDANQPAPDAIRQLRVRAVAGQMGGLVVDPSGAVVANARVTVTPSNGEPANVVTDAQGVWLIAGLPSGKYTAQASMPGFKTESLDFNYDARQPAMYSFTLSPGIMSETVAVNAAEGTVQTESATLGNAIASNQVQPLPIQGRNVANLVALAPGAAAQASVRWNITAAGSLQRSVDQGATWQDVDVNASSASATSVAMVAKSYAAKEATADKKALKQPPTTLVFRVIAVNGADVWAGGSGGSLYHSLDAGDHWTRVVPFAAGSALTGDVVSLQFPDSQHGTVTTSTPEVWSTSNNGATWQKQ